MKRHLDFIFMAFVEKAALVSSDTTGTIQARGRSRAPPRGHFQSGYG